MNIDHYN